MRILQVIDTLAPVGGAQRYVHDVTDLLTRAGHEVAVLHGDAVGDERPGVATERYGAPSARTWICSFRPDVVHVHGLTLPAGLEVVLEQHPVVRSLHAFGFGCATGTKYFRNGNVCSRPHGPGCLVTGFARGCTHRVDPRPLLRRYRLVGRELPVIRSAAAVLVHSRFMRDVALENQLPAERVIVLPLFTRTDGSSPEPSPARTVAFAGRIVPEKGLDVLIKGLAERRDAWDRLLVAGDGWDRQRCERLARDDGIQSKIDFLGHVDAETSRRTLGEARVVAVPSRWPEPFGIVGLEAMALARPVVGSRIGGIPEWLDDRETGLLVPPGDESALADALVSLLTDEGHATALGLEARRRVERFSPEVHLRHLVGVYEHAAAADREPLKVGAL